MHADDEKLLRLAKEIVIKFIEVGRVSPNNFEDHFKNVFWALKRTIVDARVPEFILDEQQDKDKNGDEEKGTKE